MAFNTSYPAGTGSGAELIQQLLDNDAWLEENGGAGGDIFVDFAIDSRDDDGEPSQVTIDGVSYTITRDANGRLSSISDGSSTITYTYDDTGNLTGGTVS